jgi:hypothetical protein
MDTQHDFGPIQELRFALGSKSALAVGAAMGGAAPLVNYFTVHLGELVVFDPEKHTFEAASWDNPLWLMVIGTFALSCKSVYQWGCNAYENDRLKACGLVAMLEGALLLSPHWAIGVGALVFLVLINMAASGASIARRDLRDKAVVEARRAPSPMVDTSVELDNPPSTAFQPETASALPELPAPALPVSRVDSPGFERLRGLWEHEFVQGLSAVSAKALRERFGVPHRVAAGLMEALDAEGALGEKNSLGQRVVLPAV